VVGTAGSRLRFSPKNLAAGVPLLFLKQLQNQLNSHLIDEGTERFPLAQVAPRSTRRSEASANSTQLRPSFSPMAP
jgi:hypothetical protein